MREKALLFFSLLMIVSPVFHIVFSYIAEFKLRLDENELNEIFALWRFKFEIPRWGGPGSRSMRTRLFLPWVSLHLISKRPLNIRIIVWAARLSGMLFCVGLFGMLAVAILTSPFLGITTQSR